MRTSSASSGIAYYSSRQASLEPFWGVVEPFWGVVSHPAPCPKTFMGARRAGARRSRPRAAGARPRRPPRGEDASRPARRTGCQCVVGWCGARQERLLGLRWICYHPSSCERSRRKFERAVCALSTMLSHPNLSCVARLMRPPPVISAPHPPSRLSLPLAYHPTTAGRGRRPASLR